MADTGIMATTQEIQDKAGANASATFKAEAYTNRYIAQAESRINCLCRVNYSDEFAGLDSDYQKLLTEVASNLAAIYVIEADMSGYTSRGEAELMIKLLYKSANDGLKILADPQVQKFLGVV